MECAGTRFMHSLTDLNFHSDDESSRYSDKPLPVDWKVYDVLLYDFRTQPGQNAWRPCSCRCPTAISIRRKAASRGARCVITDIASCSRRRPAGRHVPIRNGDRRGAWTTRAMTVIRSRFSIPGVIESPRPARTWSDRALLLRRRDTSISFSRDDGPHEAYDHPHTVARNLGRERSDNSRSSFSQG